MTQQILVDSREQPKQIKCDQLGFGQLGMVVGHGENVDGTIITRIFGGFVCLYVPPDSAYNNYKPFRSTWEYDPGFMVEILPATYKLELSN